MPRDPYGYETDRPRTDAPDAASAPLTLLWALLTLGFTTTCAACGVWGGLDSDAEGPIERVGVGLILAMLAFPALGVAVWSIGLHFVTRRWWAQAGPNLLLGVVTGTLAWIVIFCGWACFGGVMNA